MPPKRKRSTTAAVPSTNSAKGNQQAANSRRQTKNPSSRSATRGRQTNGRATVDTNPDQNEDVVDGVTALRASPDADEKGESFSIDRVNTVPLPVKRTKKAVKVEESTLQVSENDETAPTPSKKVKKQPTKSSVAAKKGSDEIKAFKAEQAAKKVSEIKIKKEDDDGTSRADPDGDEDGPMEDADTIKREAARPPPVNSDYLPLPWKGRLGYACLNTYLRLSNPPIFSSRTCRIQSILDHRHPLQDPSQPEHSTKNRPDKTQPAEIARGQRYVEELGIANARDIAKMLRWNEKYGIRFLRLSSEMFPFASHEEYGYKLAPFASEVLADAGRVAAELGHRLTTHPGQFTQLGSPRAAVIDNAIRDLDYHDELLSLLKLPPQQDRDAVMILHLGGTFGDKAATLDRFRENYKSLSQSVKNRLVLENDDVSWSVHDLLPLCEELNIPLVLDFHHHNIIFDNTQLREGTQDIMSLYPRIKATWDRKNIRQKMHYSEPTSAAITGRERRKHNPRPLTMPPCPDDMDLMIEAKDKEQAVFELMRTFKLPGWNTFNNLIPYERNDDNRPEVKKAKKKKTKKQIAMEIEEFGKEIEEEEEITKSLIHEDEVGMGGQENRVYWPIGMEEWLRPKKREVKKKDDGAKDPQTEDSSIPTPHNFAARLQAKKEAAVKIEGDLKARLANAMNVGDAQAVLDEMKASRSNTKVPDKALVKKATPAKKIKVSKLNMAKNVPTPSVSDIEDDEDELSLPDLSADEEEDEDVGPPKTLVRAVPARVNRRASARTVSYVEGGESDIET